MDKALPIELQDKKPIVIVTLLSHKLGDKALVAKITEALSPFCQIAIFDKNNETIKQVQEKH